MVGRIAKIKGAASVVGIAGSDDKCAWMVNEAGFDHAINDKTQDVADELSRLVPSGIDLFWDNVGGPSSTPVWDSWPRGPRRDGSRRRCTWLTVWRTPRTRSTCCSPAATPAKSSSASKAA